MNTAKTIMPEVLQGVSIPRAQYDAIPAVRATELKIAAKSLWHYNEYRKGNFKKKKSKGQDLGIVSHSVNLENDISRVMVFDGVKKDGSEYEGPRLCKPFQKMVEANPDKIVVTKEEFKELVDKRAAYLNGVGVPEILKGAKFEQAFCAQDPITGLWLKCQADITKLEEFRFADLKGVPDASERGVGRMAANAKWPIQIGHYAYVIELATGIKMKRFDFIGQEINAPHYTEAHELSAFDFENCAQVYRELLNRLAIAMKEDVWPGYKKDATLVLPPWSYAFEDADESWGAA